MSASLEAQLRLDIAQYEAQLAQAKAAANKLKADLAKSQGGFGKGLLGGLVGGGVVGTIVAVGRTALTTVTGVDRMRRAMTSAEHSAEGAAARLGELNEAAKLPGIDFDAAVEADIGLRAVGLSADLSKKSMIEFGNALALSGGKAEDFAGTMEALKQIGSLGKVTADNINQIANRVPQIRAVMKDAFGTADTEELQKMGITSKEFITKLVEGFSKLPRATAGLDEDLADMGQSMKSIVDAGFSPMVKELVPELRQMASSLAENKDLFAGIGEGLAAGVREGAKFGDFLGEARDILGDITGITKQIGILRGGALAQEAALKAFAISQPGARTARDAALVAGKKTAAPNGDKGATPPPTATPGEADLVKHRQAALALQQKESALDEKRYEDYLRTLTPNQKLLELRRQIMGLESQNATLQGPGLEDKRLDNASRILSLRQQTREVLKDIADKEKEASEKSGDQKDALSAFDREMEIINAKIAGNKKLTQELERQVQIEEQKQKLMDQAGLDEKTATAKATAMVDARQQLEDKEKNKRKDGRERINAHIEGGVDDARQRAEKKLDLARSGRDRRVTDTFGTLQSEDARLKGRFKEEFGGLNGQGKPNDPAANPLAPNAAKNAAAENAASNPQTGGTAEQAAQIVLQVLPQILSTLSGGS